MSFLTQQYRRVGVATTSLLLGLGSLGCKDIIKRDRVGSESAVSGIIDRNYLFLERKSDRTGALVSFRTTVAAHCAFKFWPSEDPGARPSEVTFCGNQNPDGERDFSELIQPLEPMRDYSIEIYAWPVKATINQADRHTIREEALPIDDRDLYVARIDATLRHTEVHRHRLAKSFSPEAISSQLHLQPGCQGNISQPALPFSDAAQVSRLTSVMTRGFGLAESIRHPRYSNRRVLSYGFLQQGDDWEWLFAIDHRGYRFVSREPSLLSQVDLVNGNGESREVSNSQLTIAPETIELEEGRGIVVRWAAGPLFPTSYVTVRIGPPGGRGLTCVFPAADNEGEVPWPLLSGLPKSSHDLQVNLYSAQLFLRAGEDTVPWLIIGHDWRTGRIQIK